MFFVVWDICLLDNVCSKQLLNIRVDRIESGLDRGFVKHRLNFFYITAALNVAPINQNRTSFTVQPLSSFSFLVLVQSLAISGVFE